MNGKGNRSATYLAMTAGMLLAVVPASARDRDRGPSKPRGYVDGAAFAALAEDEDTAIQVSIQGPLLRMVTAAIGQEDKEVAKVLDEIVSITAVVVEVETESDRATKAISDTAKELSEDGWQTIARVREGGSDILVLALMDAKGEALDGLTVVVSDANDHNLIFANIAGRIDLETIGQLGMKMGVPGLNELSGDIFKSEGKKRKSRSSRDDE